jgi:hypothetical protein
MRVFKWASVYFLVALFSGCAMIPMVDQDTVYLTISSEPSGARIYEGGELLGNSPLTLPARPQQYGTRSYTATKEGYRSQTKIYQFPQDNRISKISMLFILEPQGADSRQQQQQQQQTTIVMSGTGGVTKIFGTLTIITTPAQAEVYVDGTFVATTPVSNLQIEVGPHKIEIQKSGYKTWARTWQVLPNSPVKIEVELEKVGGGF